MPEYRDLFLDTPDNHRIAVHCWRSDAQAPLGTVHWLHGMAEHGGRYHGLAERVNAAGWHLVTHDHRGHGASVPAERERGHFADQAGWQHVLDDVEAVQSWLRAELDGQRQVLGGHSMGSFVALDTAESTELPFNGLILCGSDYHRPLFYSLMQLPMLWELRRHGHRGLSHLIRRLTFDTWNRQVGSPETDFDWLSTRADQVNAYIADPYCGHDCTVGLWLDLVSALKRMHHPEALAQLPDALPILVVGGNRDPMSQNGRGCRNLARALEKAGKQVSLTLFDGRHEILNDQCADEVNDTLIRFLDNQCLSSTTRGSVNQNE
jgi:alpha-beta hydrolase superfamily lysophospholipase